MGVRHRYPLLWWRHTQTRVHGWARGAQAGFQVQFTGLLGSLVHGPTACRSPVTFLSWPSGPTWPPSSFTLSFPALSSYPSSHSSSATLVSLPFSEHQACSCIRHLHMPVSPPGILFQMATSLLPHHLSSLDANTFLSVRKPDHQSKVTVYHPSCLPSLPYFSTHWSPPIYSLDAILYLFIMFVFLPN